MNLRIAKTQTDLCYN